MSNIKIHAYQIDDILGKAEIHAETIFEKVTFVAVKLENGFVLTESSGAVDKANYDFELGKEVCLRKIKDRIWMLEGYRLQEEVYRHKGWYESNEVTD